jgi:hypothetical protein
MRERTTYTKFATGFSELDPGWYFVELRKEYPSAPTLIAAVPVVLSDDEIEMFAWRSSGGAPGHRRSRAPA